MSHKLALGGKPARRTTPAVAAGQDPDVEFPPALPGRRAQRGRDGSGEIQYEPTKSSRSPVQQIKYRQGLHAVKERQRS